MGERIREGQNTQGFMGCVGVRVSGWGSGTWRGCPAPLLSRAVESQQGAGEQVATGANSFHEQGGGSQGASGISAAVMVSIGSSGPGAWRRLLGLGRD